MHYIPNEYITKEHVQYIDDNQSKPCLKSWVNVSEAHEIEIVQVGFKFYVKAIFGPNEYYYVTSFDSEKAAKHYIHDLFD